MWLTKLVVLRYEIFDPIGKYPTVYLFNSGPESHVKHTSVRPLWCGTTGAGSGSETQPGPISGRFHVSIDGGGISKLEITDCDFKLGWSAASRAVCVYGARGGHVVERPEKSTGGPGQHHDHEGLCSSASIGVLESCAGQTVGVH